MGLRILSLTLLNSGAAFGISGSFYFIGQEDGSTFPLWHFFLKTDHFTTCKGSFVSKSIVFFETKPFPTLLIALDHVILARSIIMHMSHWHSNSVSHSPCWSINPLWWQIDVTSTSFSQIGIFFDGIVVMEEGIVPHRFSVKILADDDYESF